MDTPENVRLKKSTSRVQLSAPGRGSSLRFIRQVVADLARKIGFPDDEVAKIEMAVDEACSNVVEHAYGQQFRQQADPEIGLEVRKEDGRLVIEINDHGQKFDFASYQPTNIESRLNAMKTSGYGISIMRRFMDEVQYSSNDQTGNTLRLVKYLKKA